MLSHFNGHSRGKKEILFYHRIVKPIPLSHSALKETFSNLIIRGRKNAVTEETMSQKNDFYKRSQDPDLPCK